MRQQSQASLNLRQRMRAAFGLRAEEMGYPAAPRGRKHYA